MKRNDDSKDSLRILEKDLGASLNPDLSARSNEIADVRRDLKAIQSSLEEIKTLSEQTATEAKAKAESDKRIKVLLLLWQVVDRLLKNRGDHDE